MSEIKSISEQEHITDDEEFLEMSDLSPHAIIINHEPPGVNVERKYNDSFGIKADKSNCSEIPNSSTINS